MARFRERFAKQPLNERQIKVLNHLLDGFEGKLTSSQWAKLAKCSQDTAHRDNLDLIERGALQKDPRWRTQHQLLAGRITGHGAQFDMIRNLLIRIRRGLMAPRPDVPTLRAVGAEEICPSFVAGRIQLERVAECEAGVSIVELTLLAHLARSRADARIFEIGTSRGRTTLNLALNVGPGGHVFSLDLPQDADVDPGQYAPAQEVEVRVLRRAEYLLGRTDRLPVTLLQGDSTRFDFSPWYGGIDLVFIDGGHVRTVLESDTVNAFRMIRDGGMILWHDYLQASCPEVTAFLEDIGRLADVRYVRGTNLVVWSGGRRL